MNKSNKIKGLLRQSSATKEDKKGKLAILESFIQYRCPICMEDLKDDQVAAMCSHIYCCKKRRSIIYRIAKCIMSYWRSKREGEIECPYCRRHITFLIMKDESKVDERDREDIYRFNNNFNADRSVSKDY